MTATLVYLYAVTTPAGPWLASKQPAGLEGKPLRAIEEGDLTALVSEVPESAYGQDALDANVRDGHWLTPRATSHQEVNAAAHDALDAVLPVSFGTIYLNDDRVREMLRERDEDLRAKLASVRGQAEWVVGLYRDVVQAAEHLSRMRDAIAHKEHVTAGPGRRYLEDRKAETSQRAELRGLDEEAAASADQILARVSRHSFDEPILADAGDLVARTTYLVRQQDERRLRDALDHFNADWRDRGYELRLTGPWPAYRTSGAKP